VLGSFCAYAIARRLGRLSNVVYIAFVVGIILPFQLAIIPLYTAMNHLGLVGTYLGMIVLNIGLLMPLTWWIEGVRHALFPGGVSGVGGSGSFFEGLTGSLVPTSAEIVAALLVTGAVATLASVAVFRVSDRRAKDRGLLDRTTGS